jgi:hypothetical protein
MLTVKRTAVFLTCPQGCVAVRWYRCTGFPTQ